MPTNRSEQGDDLYSIEHKKQRPVRTAKAQIVLPYTTSIVGRVLNEAQYYYYCYDQIKQSQIIFMIYKRKIHGKKGC